MLYPNGTTRRPKVSSPYGPRDPRIGVSSFHRGADLIGFEIVHAVAAGRVTFAGRMNNAAGNTIVVDHGNGVTSVYMHNKSHKVRRGDRVREGQPIAVMGSTGNASGVCSHLEIRIKGESVEPLGYIARHLTTTTNEGDDMYIIRIKGKAGARRGGLYAIFGGTEAVFLGNDDGATVPTITDDDAIAALQKRVSGIG